MAHYRQSDYGKYSGASAENDDLSLNRCPDCDVLFDGPVCPICKKECPPEMRAGVRQPIRHVKEKVVKGATMTPFYFRWWFIAIMFFVSRLIALILLWMSNMRKWLKVLLTVIFALVLVTETLMMTGVIPNIMQKISMSGIVNYKIDEKEYRQSCEECDNGTLYRNVNAMKGKYVCGTAKVIKILDNSTVRYYILEDSTGNAVALLDARKGKPELYLAGDTVTFFGQCAGELFDYYDNEVNERVPLVYMAYSDSMNGEVNDSNAKAA